MDNNRITKQLNVYLQYKHSFGFKLVHEATVLERSASYTRFINYEPVRLLVDDVDFENQILHIRKTKFLKDRYIPIHESVVNQLYAYLKCVEQKFGLKSLTDPFFYTTVDIRM